MAYSSWGVSPLDLFLGILFVLLLPVVLVGRPVGLLGSLVELVLLGVATLRTRILPPWFGMFLIVLEPAAMAYGVRFLIFKPDLLFASFTFFPPEVMAFRGPFAIWQGPVLGKREGRGC